MPTRTPRSHWPRVSRVKKKAGCFDDQSPYQVNWLETKDLRRLGYVQTFLFFLFYTYRYLGKCTDPLLHMTDLTEKTRNLHKPAERTCDSEDMSQKNQDHGVKAGTSAESCPFLVSMIRSASLPLRVARAPTRTTQQALCHTLHIHLTNLWLLP